MSSSNLTGLATLFRRNPYDDRVKQMGEVAARSGFARPLVMGRMGEAQAKGEAWDEEKAGTLEGLYRGNMEQERADKQRELDLKEREHSDKLFNSVVELAKFDPVAATKIFRQESKSNQHLKSMGDMKFLGGGGKDAIIHLSNTKTGEASAINAGNYMARLNDIRVEQGREPSEEEKAQVWMEESHPIFEGGSEEGTHKVGDTRKIGKTVNGRPIQVTEEYKGKEKGWVERGDIPAFAPKSGEEGEGAVKPTASKALKIEVARKFASMAIREIEAKRAAATPKELQAVTDIKKWLSNVDPLTKDFNPDSIYAALPSGYQEAFDRVLLDAEDAFPKTRKVGRAVDDALAAYNRRNKKPETPRAGGSDWRKYLKPGKK
jgi:hypothetical protein